MNDKPQLGILQGGKAKPRRNVPMDYEQENDGDITVSLMSDMTVQITDRSGGLALNMPMFLAMDVGRRTIDMATEAIRRHLIEVERQRGATGVVPYIQVVHGTLPET